MAKPAWVRDPRQWGWPTGSAAVGSVDVLLWSAAPAASAAQVDGAVGGFATQLRLLAPPPTVWTVSRDGELRVVIRFANTTLDHAQNTVQQTWQRSMPVGLASPQIAAIAPGNRARIGWAVTSDSGDQAATIAAENAVPTLTATMPQACRTLVAGAVRPVLFADVLTRTALAQQVTLASIAERAVVAVQSARSAAGSPASPPAVVDATKAQQAALHAALATTKVTPAATKTGPKVPQLPLTSVVAARHGVGEPVQLALVGRNAAPLLLVEAGVGRAGSELTGLEAGWRRDPATKRALGTATLHPQNVESAYRLILTVDANLTAEAAPELAKRLLAIRALPNVVGAFAISGQDGVPTPLQPESARLALWTVWISVAASDQIGANALVSARELLGAGGWQSTELSANYDTALGWALQMWGGAGAILTGPDPASLRAIATKVAASAQARSGLVNVRLGPHHRPVARSFARWNAQAVAASGLQADELAMASVILQSEPTAGAVAIGRFGTTSVYLTLPRGEMQAETGKLPLAFRATATGLQSVCLQDLLQTPAPAQALDHIRVNGAPALTLVAEAAHGTTGQTARIMRDTFDRSGPFGSVKAWSLTVADPALALDSSVP
ncbi:MAG: hypothetical protein EXR77_18340 [Myxococcales bacterium]|nr:hypothetical protein [Myxococcales bacterium]